jgi:hypothetical protein
LAQQFRHVDLALGRRAERQTAERRIADRSDDLGMGMTEDQRPPRADIVDVAGTVGVGDACAGAGDEEARRAADRAKRPHRRIDPTRDVLLRTLKQLLVS